MAEGTPERDPEPRDIFGYAAHGGPEGHEAAADDEPAAERPGAEEEYQELTGLDTAAAAVAYARLKKWERGQRERLKLLGIPDDLRIPPPPGFVAVMMSDSEALGADFDFDNYEVVLEGDKLKTVRKPSSEQGETQQVEEVFCPSFPCGWSSEPNGRVDEREQFFLSGQRGHAAEVVFRFVDGDSGSSRIVEVPGLPCELQYVVQPDGRQFFLFRSGLTEARRAALLCVLLEALGDPATFANMKGPAPRSVTDQQAPAILRPLKRSQVEAAGRLCDRIAGYRACERALDAISQVRTQDGGLGEMLVLVKAIDAVSFTNLRGYARPMARHILRVLRRPPADPVELVERIARPKGAPRRFYSFASTLVHFLLAPGEVPVYDEWAVDALRYHLVGRKGKLRRSYSAFAQGVAKLREETRLDCSVREMDRYLWLAGQYRKYHSKRKAKDRRKVKLSGEVRELFASRDPEVRADLAALLGE